MILEMAVGLARVGCQAARWQGATTQRASARKEKQRRQGTAWQINRAGSALTPPVKVIAGEFFCIHGQLQWTQRGQLPFLG